MVKVLCYKWEGRWFDSRWCHWNFSLTYIPSVRTMGLGSTQSLTEIPGTFSGGKDCRCVRLTTLPPSCAVVMKSGDLNFLEPSGLLQACNETALSLNLPILQEAGDGRDSIPDRPARSSVVIETELPGPQ